MWCWKFNSKAMALAEDYIQDLREKGYQVLRLTHIIDYNIYTYIHIYKHTRIEC